MVTHEGRVGVSIPELSQITGVSESVYYGLAAENRLTGCRRVGTKRYLVHLPTFMRWLQEGTGNELTEGK